MRKPESRKLLSRRTLLATLLVSLNRQQKELLYGFLHRQVVVKCVDEIRIEGELKHVDRSEEHHDSLGNLILANNAVVRGNLVLAVCIEEP